jgi:hypothetical protein
MRLGSGAALAFVFWFGGAGSLNGSLKIMQPRQRNAHFSSEIDCCKIGTFFNPGAVMQIYYPSLSAIQQQTLQLDHAQCTHCRQTQQLVSHGFVRKKRVGAAPQAVGKRVFCSNRNRRTGCGRTMQLYVDSIVRHLHHAGCCVVAFVLSLMAGMTIQRAYRQATGAATPRHAYRWLNRLGAQLSVYRSLSHRPPLQDAAAIVAANRPVRLASLMSTFTALLQQFEQPLCAAYQSQLQRPFL